MTSAAGAEDEEGPVRYVIRLSDDAWIDIGRERDRLADISGDGVADEWMQGLMDAIGRLNLFPTGYPLAPEGVAEPGAGEIRQMVYRRSRKAGRRGAAHHVLYTVDDPEVARSRGDAPEVRVLHVHHAARGAP